MISIFKGAQDAAGKLNVRSALNPFLWLCGIAVPVLLTAAVTFDHSNTLRPFCPLLVYTAVSLVIVTLFVGVGFAVLRPEKLQSEDYQIRQQALLMFQMGATPQIIDPANVVAIANPASKQIGIKEQASK